MNGFSPRLPIERRQQLSRAVRTYWPPFAAVAVLIGIAAYGSIHRSRGIAVVFAATVLLSIMASISHLHHSIGRPKWGHLLQLPYSISAGISLVLISQRFIAAAVLIFVAGMLNEMLNPQATPNELKRTGIILGSTLGVIMLLRALTYFGIYQPQTLLSPFEISALNAAVITSYLIYVLQSLWQFQRKISGTVTTLKHSNETLAAGQIALQQRIRERNQQLEASRAVSSTQRPDSLLRDLLTQLRGVVEYGRATVLLAHEGALEEVLDIGDLPDAPNILDVLSDADGRVDEEKRMLNLTEPLIVADAGRFAAGIAGALMAIPLIVRGRLIGVFILRHACPGFYTRHHADLCTTFANQIAGMLNAARLQESTATAMVVAERHRIARRLHDSVAQSLFGVVLGTRTALEQIGAAPEAARAALTYSIELAGTALAEMRALLLTLRPLNLEQQGIIAALRSQIDLLQPHNKLRIRLDTPDGEPDMPIDLKEALYQLATEVLQNVTRNPDRRELLIRIRTHPETRFEIIDSGPNVHRYAEHDQPPGVKIVRERVTALGGTLDIAHTPDVGAHIVAALHIPQRFAEPSP